MSEPILSIPITEKYRLDAELARARQEVADAERRATVAERKLQSFRRDARSLLEQMAARITTASQRKEAAATLLALSRRLELEAEIES